MSTPHLLLRAVVCSAIRRVEVLLLELVNIIVILQVHGHNYSKHFHS